VPETSLTYEQKCQRFSDLTDELRTLVDAGKTRELTDEECHQFQSGHVEAKTLMADIKRAKADGRHSVLSDVETFRKSMDEPGWKPSPVNPLTSDPAENLQKRLSDFARGRFSLRNFKGEGGQLAAYKTGLIFMAASETESPRKRWALQRIASLGASLESLAPFQAEDSNVAGGYLVFPEFESALIVLREQYGVLQRNAYRMPMASDTLIVPRRAGGTTVYYPGENGQLTESQMLFDQIQLICKKYAQMTRWSTELNDDAVIAMADILADEFAYEFAKAEDINGFIGDGTSAYAGVVGLLTRFISGTNGVVPTPSVQTAAAGHTTVGALTLADWEQMVGLLPLYAEGKARWYMHKSVFYGSPVHLMDQVGGNIGIFVSAGAPLRFLGYDVEIAQAMPTASSLTGGQIVAVLGDMTKTSFMGVRRGVTTRTSDQRYIEFDQLAIQCTERVALQSVVGDSVAPATTPGPMVALKLATS